ncbi:SMP-30/gluconolactonase/LRE family protein [Prauserella cavernicola]|uniref:SMP-30/gluconolactonase/LRE family protein n=1 Tax=Prauserella cavernicola TaxID=2800127 RepID=A0A934QX40_9PSEU|nr:SMP-30/gluconolactonase/LRE family protein [Prauserella cavernicola]MBK1787144.1 SMP-30/gluconolactonase/LRE family protein [Prauserella cavernicola]
MSRTASTIVTDMSYTECPRWHDGRIWFSDFYTYRVYSAAEDGSDLRVEADVPEQPSGLGWLPDGRLLIVSMRDRRVLRREANGNLVTHADLSGHVGGHLNDMVVDERGRAFIGEFGFDLMGGAALATAGMVRVDPDGTVRKVADDMWFPNGSVITDDGTLLVCETFGNRVTAFDIADDGTLTGRRVWATFGEQPTEVELDKLLAQVVVGADGCCLDADGSLWIADAVGGRVIRVREGGEIDEEVRTGSGVFACMLGGQDGRTLFLSCAPDFHEDARKQAREGSLLSARVDTPRAGRP